MNDADLKKLRELIKEEIRPVKEIVEVIKKKIDSQELHIHVTTENVRSIKEQQSVMNEKLDSHSASLVSIESKLESYADSYKINKHNIERLDTRLSTVNILQGYPLRVGDIPKLIINECELGMGKSQTVLTRLKYRY